MIRVEDIVSRVDSLPPLPDTVLKLMTLINDPRSRVQDIVEAIKYDQAVTGAVLKLCNSASVGRSRKITSLNDATITLGTTKVLQLVLSVHTNSLFSGEQSGYGLLPGALWKHSVAVALASSLFARRLKLEDVALVFTAGLLHDIGKLVLHKHVAEELSEILRSVRDDGRTFAEAEHEVLGFSHEEIGALIAEKWRLPDTIVRCIRFHHAPGDLDPPDALVDTVYLANSVCLLLGIGLGENGLYYRADQAVLDRHDLRVGDLEEVGAEMLIQLRSVEQLFSEGVGPRGFRETACSVE